MALTLVDVTKNFYPWVTCPVEISVCFMLCGTRVSLLIPEAEPRALEELAGEKLYSNTSSNSGSKKSPVLSLMRSSPLSPVPGGDHEGGGEDIFTHRRCLNQRHCHLPRLPWTRGRDGSSRPANGGAHREGWTENIPLQDMGRLLVRRHI
jgi:hypothetical protein